MTTLNDDQKETAQYVANHKELGAIPKQNQLQQSNRTELKVTSDMELALEPEDYDSVLIDWEDDEFLSDYNKLGQHGKVDFDTSIISMNQLDIGMLPEISASNHKVRRLAMRPKKPLVLHKTLRNRGSKKSLKSSISMYSLRKSSSVATTSAKASLLSKKQIIVDEHPRQSIKTIFDNKDIFLNLFEDLPCLSDISSESELEEEPKHDDNKKVSNKTHGENDGGFFNPLTGQSLPSTSSSTTPTEISVIEEECAEALNEDELDLPSMLNEPIFRKSEISVSDFHMFRIFDKSFAASNIDAEEVVETLHTVKIREMAQEFLYNLIDTVVEKTEQAYAHDYTDNFCKETLVFKLIQLIREHNAVKADNITLNRKVVEHHKRSKTLRAITPLSPDIELKEYTRYMQELRMFDHELKKSQDLKAHYDQLIGDTHAELNHCKSEMALREENLNALIRETVGACELAGIDKEIESDLEIIHSKRKELSVARLKLIKRQHILAMLEAKTSKLDKISENLDMNTFINIQTQVQNLSKKIEERNLELKKLHRSCNTNLHILAHIKEKANIEEMSNEGTQIILNELVRQQRLKRKYIFKLKVDRGNLHKEYEELSFQSGLLDKPALLHDYDNNVVLLEKQRKRVQELRAKLSKLLDNIKAKKLLLSKM